MADAPAAIAFTAALMRRSDMRQQASVLLGSMARFAAKPIVVTAVGNLQAAAECANTELPDMLADKTVSHFGPFVKIPTAFFKMALSS